MLLMICYICNHIDADKVAPHEVIKPIYTDLDIELRKVSTKKYPDGKIYPEGSSPTLSDNQRTLKLRDARTV